MTNAGTAKKWLLDYYKGDESCVAKHFAVRVPSRLFPSYVPTWH